MAKYLTIESIKSCLQRAKTYFDNKLKLKADLTSLQSTNSNVSSLTTQLSTANSKITANEKAIATNATNISKNATNITTNTTNISKNTTNITKNTNDIADLKTEAAVIKQTLGYESRNLLPFPNSIKINNITFTFDDQGYMTSDNLSDTRYWEYQNAQQKVFLKKGSYYVSFFAKKVTTNEYANIIGVDEYNKYVFTFGAENIRNLKYDKIFFTIDSDKTIYIISKIFEGKIAISIQSANAKTDDEYYPYMATVNDRLLDLEKHSVPFLVKEFELKTIIKSNGGNLSKRIMQESYAIQVAGYTPISLNMLGINNSNYYIPQAFFSGGKENVYFNAYAATDDVFTDSYACRFQVAYIKDDLVEKTYTSTSQASDEPEDDEGLSPQDDNLYKAPSPEPKRFYGESLYE